MTPQPNVARGDLVREGIAVLRRPVPDDVGDEHLAPVEADPREELVEELAGGTDEGLPLNVLVVTGSFAEEEDPRLPCALAGDGLPRAAVEWAGDASADLLGDEAKLSVLHSRWIMKPRPAWPGPFARGRRRRCTAGAASPRPPPRSRPARTSPARPPGSGKRTALRLRGSCRATSR